MNQDYAELHAVTTTDRLTATLFLAGLLHGVIILGVTFATPREPPGGDPVTLRVTVVSPHTDPLLDPLAEILAQANMRGAGDAQPDTRFGGTIGPSGFEATASLEPLAEPVWMDEPQREAAAVVAAAADASAIPDTVHTPADTPSLVMAGVADASLTLGEDPALLPDASHRDAAPAPSTRESAIAAYMAAWRVRVEQVGTRNFPRDAAGRQAEHPVVEVVLGADGSLEEATISRSSGRPDLDRAVLEILRIAAPFPAFPEELRAEHPRLRFAYEWRFGAAL